MSPQPDRQKKKAQGREAKGASKASKPICLEVRHHNSAAITAALKAKVGGARSTAIEARRARIIAALRIGPQTSYDLRRLGCYQAPARVKELREKFDYTISTQRVTLWDRNGWPHRGAALYVLEAEPTKAEALDGQNVTGLEV